MGIWVRTQYKHILTNCSTFRITKECTKSEKYSIYGIGLIEKELGVYETKERALEVLDDIQKQIDFWNWCQFISYDAAMKIANVGFKSKTIFEMPEK